MKNSTCVNNIDNICSTKAHTSFSQHRHVALGCPSPLAQHHCSSFQQARLPFISKQYIQSRLYATQYTSQPPLPPFSPIIDPKPLDEPTPGFDSIPDALAAIDRGEAVVVLDDEDRENEGDLILAADRITSEAMAFVVNYTSGVVCIGMKGADLDRLRIPLMIPPQENEESMTTAFTITVDLRKGTSTGISASDRAATMRALASPSSLPEDFKRPGHIFPLRYREGGVLRRPGHTEASVDLAQLAGCFPAGVLCEIVNPDGTMARTPDLQRFAKEHSLRCITIADLVRYRLKNDVLVDKVSSGSLSTRYGTFLAYTYRSVLDGSEHLALVAGEPDRGQSDVLVRIHGESIIGDVFGSERCDSRSQLDAALKEIASAGRGVLVYLRGQQGRGLGVSEELKTYTNGSAEVCASPASLEDSSFPVDLRDYSVAAHILKDLKVNKVRLMTNNGAKENCLKAHGIKVASVVPHVYGGLDEDEVSEKRGVGRSSRNGAEPHFV